MGKRKRGKRREEQRSSSSDEYETYRKLRKDDCDSDTDSVSNILSQVNSILYGVDEENEDLTKCVFEGDQTGNTTDTSSSTMASGSNNGKQTGSNTGSNQDQTANDKLDSLLKAVADIKKSQDSMQRMFESKLDRLRTDLMENIDTKVRALRDELTMDLAREGNRIDGVLKTIEAMQGRLDTVEHKQTEIGPQTTTTQQPNRREPKNPLSDPDLCVVVSGLPVTDNENMMEKAESLISAIGEDVSTNVLITGAIRLPTRLTDKPGLVKIGFQNVEEKVLVLRRKWRLKDSEDYKRVYVKSCKSHAERLIELNARALLRSMPGGRNFRVDASGRIKRRTEQAGDQD